MVNVTWELLGDEIANKVWDQYLLQFDGFTPYQFYAWGEHRRHFGWVPYRWVAYNDNREIVAMVQTIFKSYKLGVWRGWSSGGPIGDISNWGKSLHEAALTSTGASHLYLRFFSNRKGTKDDQVSLESQGWKRACCKLYSGFSMTLSIDKTPEEMRRGLSRNWRHNLKRAEKSGLTIRQWVSPNIDDILALYNSMERHKGIVEQFSRQEIQSIFHNLGDKIVLYRCDDKDGQLVAIRGCIILGRFAWDWFASSNVVGRTLYASYALFWEIFLHCQKSGVKEYELNGVDPTKNLGVYNFKKGTGAELLEYLGEWEWATNRLLRFGANVGVRLRRKCQ